MEAATLFNNPRQPLLAPEEASGSPPARSAQESARPPAPAPTGSSPRSRRLPPQSAGPARGPGGEPEGGAPGAAGGGAPVSFFGFIGHQLLIGVDETVTAEMEDESARRRRKGVYHFLRAPWELEKLLLLGYLVCLDSFLFMVTMLPLRVAASLVTLATRRRLSWLQTCDVMCVGAIAIAVYALGQIDTSQAYHSVKGQAVIKLYVVFNVLEVFDKLCASFGQVRGGPRLHAPPARARLPDRAPARSRAAPPRRARRAGHSAHALLVLDGPAHVEGPPAARLFDRGRLPGRALVRALLPGAHTQGSAAQAGHHLVLRAHPVTPPAAPPRRLAARRWCRSTWRSTRTTT